MLNVVTLFIKIILKELDFTKKKKKKKMWRADPREKTKAAKFYHVILE